jgi:hypothetical protein
MLPDPNKDVAGSEQDVAGSEHNFLDEFQVNPQPQA